MLIAAGALAAMLLVRAGRIAWGRWRAPALPPAGVEAPDGAAAVAVLLPVRDEEADVVPCVETLLAQTRRPRIRVIDDGSGDRTAERVRALIATLPAPGRRLELRAAGDLPAGWGGKVHALDRGLDGVEAPWILTTDADTRHAPEALARALAAAERHDLDLVSLAARQEVGSLGEALLTPGVFALLDAALGDWRAHAAGRAAAPVANGQYLLMRRSALLAAGGFSGVRGEALDDVALARAFAAAGRRVGFLRAHGLLSVRMYRGLAATWRGWRRNLALIFGPRPTALWTAVAGLALPGIFLLAALTTGEWRAAAAVWAGGVVASALIRASGGQPTRHALLWPGDDLGLAALLVQARRDHRRRRLAPWKGRPVAPAQEGGSGAS